MAYALCMLWKDSQSYYTSMQNKICTSHTRLYPHATFTYRGLLLMWYSLSLKNKQNKNYMYVLGVCRTDINDVVMVLKVAMCTDTDSNQCSK